MIRTFAAAVFALLTVTAPADAATLTLTLWNVDLTGNGSALCGALRLPLPLAARKL
jgi:hypothetical protein